MITTQILIKSQEGIDFEPGGDFPVYLSVPEEDQPGDTAVSTSRSRALALSNMDPHLGGFLPYLGPSIHASILDILFLAHLLLTFPITLISSSHTRLLPAGTVRVMGQQPGCSRAIIAQPPAG